MRRLFFIREAPEAGGEQPIKLGYCFRQVGLRAAERAWRESCCEMALSSRHAAVATQTETASPHAAA